jgi:hypothetical protein
MLDIRQKIQIDSLQYLPKNWCGKPQTKALQKIKYTISLLQACTIRYGVDVFFDGSHSHFGNFTDDDLNIKIKLAALEGSDVGYYDPTTNTLAINKEYINEGLVLYETILHEFVHKLQWAIFKKSESDVSFVAQSPYVLMLRAVYINENPDFIAMGINCGKNVYVNGSIEYGVPDIDALSSSLYVLSSIERQAFLIAERYCREALSGQLAEFIANHETFSSIQLRGAVRDFVDIYETKTMSRAEIYKLVDAAQKNIILGTKPKTNLEASLTYDMAALLAFQNQVITYEDYMYMMSDDVKRGNMTDQEYKFVKGAAHSYNLPAKEFEPEDLPMDIDELKSTLKTMLKNL